MRLSAGKVQIHFTKMITKLSLTYLSELCGFQLVLLGAQLPFQFPNPACGTGLPMEKTLFGAMSWYHCVRYPKLEGSTFD